MIDWLLNKITGGVIRKNERLYEDILQKLEENLDGSEVDYEKMDQWVQDQQTGSKHHDDQEDA